MKGLYRYLSPAAPDQSGAVSVLFELGGMIIVTDAGGCTGNICGFDEPRWGRMASAVYSAGLRDMDAILGRDDRLMEKIEGTARELEPYFIALIGTPVPSVIATDYYAIAKLIEKELSIPALYVETTGMEAYDAGQKKAYEAVLKFLARGRRDPSSAAGSLLRRLSQENEGKPAPDLGIWGATPLDLPGIRSAEKIREQALEEGFRNPVCYGMDSGLWELSRAAEAKENAVVSWSGLAPARALEKRGIPWHLGRGPACEGGITEAQMRELAEQVRRNSCPEILILHQQLAAEALRRRILGDLPEAEGHVTVGSFFHMDDEFRRPGDLQLEGESDLIRVADGGRFGIIMGDPLYRRALRNFEGTWISLPHYAVSGQMYRKD